MTKPTLGTSLFPLGGDPSSDSLIKGRYPCGCQARRHALVRNCLSCGRVVCAQEGSGPCFTCGTLVCTREERAVLSANNKESYALLKRLMDNSNEDGGGPMMKLGGSEGMGGGIMKANDRHPQQPQQSLAQIGDGIVLANAYREKLLAADRDRERTTRVNDLESDYFCLENNVYLSAGERDAIIRRKEELRQMAYDTRHRRVLDLDLTNRSIEEKAQQSVETVDDPIIQQILAGASAKAHTAMDRSEELTQLADFVKDFVPRYVPEEKKMKGVVKKGK